MRTPDYVHGWEVRKRDDGSFAVHDAHGMVDGPFGRCEEAMAAALSLPKPRPPSALRFGSGVLLRRLAHEPSKNRG